MIRRSTAPVVVLASTNDVKSYVAATKSAAHGKANLVMTLDRRGKAFPDFFAKLFRQMRAGASMPIAWVKLAPQRPGAAHEDCPNTICALELGQLAFG